jgi:hypothetical protein
VQDAAGGLIGRRNVLIGTAAAAGAAVASTSPAAALGANAAPQTDVNLGRAPLAVAQAAGIAAADVSVTPAGEIIDTDVQAALEDLDRRLGKVRAIDDLQVAMTLIDDFMGSSAATGTIGELGWARGFGATGTAQVGVQLAGPGVFAIGTGTSATGWQNLNLGNRALVGGPAFMSEWRIRLPAVSSSAQAFSVWFGLNDDLLGNEPGTGFYFRYTPGDGPNWQGACALNGSRTVLNLGVPADTNFHRFRMTCDGAGVVRFYIDSVLRGTITTNAPTISGGHAPSLSLRKSTGTTSRSVFVDYFALRYEFAR